MSTPESQDPTARLTRAEIEVPGSPEQVWQAIATGAGHAAWMVPTEIEGRVGGRMLMHRGPYGGDANATVTAWEPPHRFAFEEPMGEADQAPWATEMLIEARAGGTCVLRVVSGFYRDGEAWEEMVEAAGEGWRYALFILRAYLANFPGQRGTGMDATARLVGADRADVAKKLFDALGLTGASAGDSFRAPADAPPLAGTVDGANEYGALLVTNQPAPGIVEISSFPMDAESVNASVSAHLYGDEGERAAARDGERWNEWLRERFPATASG